MTRIRLLGHRLYRPATSSAKAPKKKSTTSTPAPVHGPSCSGTSSGNDVSSMSDLTCFVGNAGRGCGGGSGNRFACRDDFNGVGPADLDDAHLGARRQRVA